MDTTTQPDKYDEQVKYLTRYPRCIYRAWMAGRCLFACVSPGGFVFGGHAGFVGCLTQIKCGSAEACTKELTKAIRADDRIPCSPHDIAVGHLPILAEWRRRIDRVLGRA